MAISENIQTLGAAFTLGILLQAAITALLLYLKGHETKLSQDRRRLVLVVFLLFTFLWAQFDFISLLIPTSQNNGCQITTIVSTICDQISRVAIGAYILFSIGHGTKSKAETYTVGSLIGLRVIAGVVFVAFTRPQFSPLCIARSSIPAVAIFVIALDTIIIGVLAIRIIQLGLMNNGSPQEKQDQSKALTFVTIGFTIWTASSVPMQLGLSYIILLARTGVPATGLTILVCMVTAFTQALIASPGDDDLASEAQSPFRPDPPRSLASNSEMTGSPVVTIGYGKNGRLFVTNPSDTPRDSPTGLFQMFKGDDQNKEMKVRVAEVRNHGGESSLTGASIAGPASAAALAFGPGASITPVPAPSSRQKKSLFARSTSSARPDIRALGISQPVLDSSSANNPDAPFARMQTIDLATAAANEKIRRADAAARILSASRPVPTRPSAQEGLRRSVSLKRKEIPKPEHGPMPSISSSLADSIMSYDISTNGATVSSISSSLSPNREDSVRRRSPRHATLEEKQTFPRPPQLQKRMMVDLPAGPRARVPERQQITPPKAETVMLLKDIVYDNPSQVNYVISTANLLAASPGDPIMKTKELERTLRDSETIPAEILSTFNNSMSSIRSFVTQTSRKTDSIMERPRPYKKDAVKARGLFPRDISEEVVSLNRRRSKSTGSMVIRKSTLMSSPGSPTNLPILPPLPLPLPVIQPPTTASNLAKLLPINGSGMTADQKISMLFPAPPGVAPLSKRRSSVPSIPSMMIDDTGLMSQFAGRTIASGFDDHPKEKRGTYRFSANTYQNIAQASVEDDAVLGRTSALKSKVSAAQTSILQDFPTHMIKNIVSSHIPATSLAISSAQTSAMNDTYPKSATILRKPLNREDEDEVPISPSDNEYNDDKDSFIEDEDSEDEQHEIETPTGEDETSVFKNYPWHRRIGDDLPTFSDRGNETRLRSMPPPPPLLLNSSGRTTESVVRKPEPEPIDTPSRAIAEIQAQLKRFEERDHTSVGSLLLKFPAGGSLVQAEESDDDGRIALLENLEKEMGDQQNTWMEMQHNINRDSTGSMLTSPILPDDQVSHTLSREPSNSSLSSFRSSLSNASGSVKRISRVRQGSVSNQTQNPAARKDASRATIWQQRLAEAQEEYMEKAPELQLHRKQSLNFVEVKSATLAPGSPTPLDSDAESEIEIPQTLRSISSKVSIIQEPRCLWQQSHPEPKQTTSLMWAHRVILASTRSASSVPVAISVRPTQRRAMSPLSHSSSSLWMKPANSGLSATRPITGLWGSRTARPKSIQTRPVTQRPPRRSKRMTFLPDIVESPSPLPHKRETLGLYQFPWGEKSDTAVYRPIAHSALSMAHPALNPTLYARSQELESDEYSSSFFDDYDEEDYDRDEDESDDDFDESTLWEIASLLKTQEGLPSTQSLLPQARDVVNDYEYDEEFDEGFPQYVEDQEFQPLQPLSYPTPRKSSLWVADGESSKDIMTNGLMQPPTPVWQSYIPDVDSNMIRSKPNREDPLSSLTSEQLWESEPIVPEHHTFCLWNPEILVEQAPAFAQDIIQDNVQDADLIPNESSVESSVEEVIHYAPLPSTVFVQPAMWNRSKTPEPEQESKGLFETDNRRSVFRTTLESPVARDLRVQRVSTLDTPSLESTDLWTAVKPHGVHISLVAESSNVTLVIAPSATLSIGMWTAPIKPKLDRRVGLFSLGNSASRTSDQEPIAIGMTLKPRAARAELPRLTSRRLWNSNNMRMIERDWISESSIRPLSPSVYSLSSGPTSPTSNRSSITSVTSISTKASSIWSALSVSSTVASAVKPTWGRKPAAPMPSMPEKKDEEEKSTQFTSKISVRPNSGKLPTPSQQRESKVLANAAMFESRAQLDKFALSRSKSGRNAAPVKIFTAPPPKPVYVPVRQQFRPIFVADWDAALQEAIAAGSFNMTTKLEKEDACVARIRRKTSPEEWESALNLAIVTGVQEVIRPALLRKKASPAEGDSALESAISEGRPHLARLKATSSDRNAALNQAVVQSQPQSTRHTATEAMWSAALMEAMPQVETIVTHMWTARPDQPADKKSSSMWQVPSSLSSPRPSLFDAVKEQTLRKAKPSKIASLEKLTSTTFWRKEDHAKSAAMHWIKISKARLLANRSWTAEVSRAIIQNESSLMWEKPVEQAYTWTAPAKTTNPTSFEEQALWSQSQYLSDKRRSIFSDVNSVVTVRKTPSKKLLLPKLKSTCLFEPSSERDQSDIHWLYVSSKTLHTPVTLEVSARASDFDFGLNDTQNPINIEKPADETPLWIVPDFPSYSRRQSLFSELDTGTVPRDQTSSFPVNLPKPHSNNFRSPSGFWHPANQNELFAEPSAVELHMSPASIDLPSLLPPSSPSFLPLTWTRPVVSAAIPSTQPGVWTATSSNTPNLFFNPHEAAWTHSIRPVASLVPLETSDLWRPSRDIPEGPRNWLVYRRFSRVQFRY